MRMAARLPRIQFALFIAVPVVAIFEYDRSQPKRMDLIQSAPWLVCAGTLSRAHAQAPADQPQLGSCVRRVEQKEIKVGNGVVSYGHGTQAYFQVMAALVPSLAVLVFVNVRKTTDGYAAILAHHRSLWRIALHAERIGFSIRITIGFYVIWAVIITVIVPLTFPIIGEIMTLVVLYNGRATRVEANWSVVAVGGLATALINSLFLGSLPEMREKTAEESAANRRAFRRRSNKTTPPHNPVR